MPAIPFKEIFFPIYASVNAELGLGRAGIWRIINCNITFERSYVRWLRLSYFQLDYPKYFHRFAKAIIITSLALRSVIPVVWCLDEGNEAIEFSAVDFSFARRSIRVLGSFI